MLRIVVTGSFGFIGRNLCNLLAQDIYPYSIIQIVHGNEHLVGRNNPDVICHLAANSLVKDSDFDIIKSNINSTAIVLESIKSMKKKPHFIFMSSATVYGNNTDTSLVSKENSVLNPSSVYAATKISSEYLIKTYANLGYIDYTILRSVANVGKFCTHGVVKDIIEKLKNDNPYLEILGECPGSCKPYIYVCDTIRAIKHCINNKIYGTYNLSTTQPIYIKELVEIIEQILKTYKPHKWLGQDSIWAGDDQHVKLNNQALLDTEFNFIALT